jgi:hypothetical protein
MAAILSAAYRIYTSINGQQQKAEQELDGLQNLITQGGPDFFSEPFRERIRGTIENCKVLEGIIVTGSQGSALTFERERGSVIQWDDANPRFIPHFGYTAPGARQVDIPGFRNVNIYSIINTINYEYLTLVLKQTLLAILAALFLSFITMILSSLGTKERQADTEKHEDVPPESNYSEELQDKNPAPEDFTSYTTPIPEEDDLDIDDFLPDFTGAGTSESPGVDADADLDFDDFDNFQNDSAPAAKDENDDFHLDDFLDEEDMNLPELETGAAIPSEPASDSDPKGLYSPRSNIGWEAYTQERLASELHRCAASEQDLVVLLFECGEGVNCDGRVYKKLADETVQFFNLQDLSFEYGDRGITLIIPNADLDHGILKAEEFHSRILKTCPETFHAKNDFLAGISSRAGRLIEADRLILEAAKALSKAQQEQGSPIVAFRSDPEKYREFVRKAVS